MGRMRLPGRNRKMVVWGLVACLGLVAGVGVAQEKNESLDEEQAAIAQAKALSRAFRSAAQKVLPTVVMVKTTSKARQANRRPGSANPFEDYFGDSPQFGGRPAPFVPPQGLGSGVIIDPKGVILTNNHVVAGAAKVVIELADGREFEATEIIVDDRTDLAIVRIEAKESLPSAKLGDSDLLEIGDWVLAIGNPFELELSVSAGIISAKGRSLSGVQRTSFLQTDAAINPGNSGGPLVNLDGEVIGINTAIASRSGGNQGIGFAIPSNLAKWVTPQLLKEGAVTRAYVGVSLLPITAELARKLGVGVHQGVAVRETYKDTPAQKAGLKKDDVIVAFDGHPVRETVDLQRLVERSMAGSSHQLDIVRDKKATQLEIVVEAMPSEFGTPEYLVGEPDTPNAEEFHTDQELGVLVVDLNESLSEQEGLEGHTGVLLMTVALGGPAAKAGLQVGMLIVRVGDQKIESVAQFKKAMKGVSLESGVSLEVRTREGSQVIRIKTAN